ncbi:Fic family protein [Sandaracinobacter neustonicus]|uniref:Fic family protein n=1 Tax=Sandaracinobacter neustonicus TaxID=1715348 RepID=A0A501XJ97_9SPHN|nr:Fic family protein [Sandaracinobacter neustonicus]TPE60479.1 Fic family protein [Sandaracinobacter neustonicus]
MRWNWQRPEWPDFQYDATRLRPAEASFLKGAGIVVGTLHHLDGDTRRAFTIEIISQETVDTSAIEGEVLDRASVQSSVAKQFGLATPQRRANAAETGAVELMVDLYRSYAQPLTDRQLFDWHRMLMHGRRDIKDIGAYRTHAYPMQIVSGPLHAPNVHYEAPPSNQVPDEMRAFVQWFNDSAPNGPMPLAAITRAAIAHLWFESIHPFEDGNGRIGRAIAEKALAQALDAPTLTALAEAIHRHRKAHYAELHRASETSEIDAWLGWFADIVLEAQARTITRIRFLIEKTRTFDRLNGKINARQEKALLRMFAEGPDGFDGGLSAHNYQAITDASSATTTRDLAELVDLKALKRTGERRYARYYLNVDIE